MNTVLVTGETGCIGPNIALSLKKNCCDAATAKEIIEFVPTYHITHGVEDYAKSGFLFPL